MTKREKELLKRIEELERKVKELEARPNTEIHYHWPNPQPVLVPTPVWPNPSPWWTQPPYYYTPIVTCGVLEGNAVVGGAGMGNQLGCAT